jgi:hypothetical protein
LERSKTPVRANHNSRTRELSSEDRSPLHNEDKSDMRGIKSGWYAIDEDGKLVFGPFDTYEECVEREVQPTYFMLARPISNSTALGP